MNILMLIRDQLKYAKGGNPCSYRKETTKDEKPVPTKAKNAYQGTKTRADTAVDWWGRADFEVILKELQRTSP